MSDFKFTSPGVKFRERNLTFVTQTVGVTTLGVVGETLKGPAFEPVFIQDKSQFSQRFGGQSTARFSNGNLKYQVPYVANAYLDESDQLYVTRVLGLSGYDEGNAWAIKLSAGVNPSTISSGTTVPEATISFSGSTFQGVTITAVSQSGTTFTGWTKTSLTGFTGTTYVFTVATYTGSTGIGTVTAVGTSYTATSYTDYENMTVAVIRSRGTVTDNVNLDPTTSYDALTVSISGVTSEGLLGNFYINAVSGATTNSYLVSLNPLSTNFIPNVLGVNPKDKKTKIYVETVYPELLKWLTANGNSYSAPFTGISSYGFSIIAETIAPTNTHVYLTPFKTPETPWVISELKGDTVTRLFKFISISDGNSANQEIKISIGNINLESYEFDVIIRDFNDTDANTIILETYTRCTLNPANNNYIGKKIGTSNGDYTLNSKYVMVEMADEVSLTSFPCGFEGIMLPNFVGAAQPKVIYKTSYISGSDKTTKTYLGFSNTAFGGSAIDQNLFNFNGYKNDGGNSTGFTKTKGFHLDVAATGTTYMDGTEVIGAFEVGAGNLQVINDVTDPLSTYYDIKKRKFTLAPAGGFDGWNEYRGVRSYSNNFVQGGIYDGVPTATDASIDNDFQAWEMAIDTFANPEAVTINLFAVPSINWSDNETLVKNTIEMIEEERTDTLYVIDAPDFPIVLSVGESKPDVVVSEDLANSLNETGIDTSYCCTYSPWVQIKDSQNNINVYISPTGEVVKAIAYNDKVKAPWYAPAGLNRGVTGAKKSKYKLSEDARGVLQKGRINPMVDYAEVGTAILGQKTLEVKESALNSISIRRLLLQIKVLIANVAIRTLFEPNDQTAIDEFLNKVNPILDKIKRERGLYEFAVKMDDTLNTPESIDREELYGEIYLKPARTIEKIGIGFTITPTGASFTDL